MKLGTIQNTHQEDILQHFVKNISEPFFQTLTGQNSVLTEIMQQRAHRVKLSPQLIRATSLRHEGDMNLILASNQLFALATLCNPLRQEVG